MNRWQHKLRMVLGLGFMFVIASSPVHAQSRSERSSAVTVANAPGSPDQIQAAAEAGRGDPAHALELIGQGLAQDPDHLDLLQLRAEILLETKQFEAATEAYRAYVAARPSPGDTRRVRAIIRNLRLSRRTRLHIEVENGPADIFLVSKRLGPWCSDPSGCDKGIMPGRYRVMVEREGFLPFREWVQVRKEQTEKLVVMLEEKPSRVSVSVADNKGDGARIYIDGQLATAATVAQEFAAGQHTIRVERPGYLSHESEFTAREGKPVLLTVELVERVEVASMHPASAELLIGDEPVEIRDGGFALPRGCESGCVVIARARGHQEREIPIPADRSPPFRLPPVELDEIPAPPPPAPPAPKAPVWRRRVAIVLGGAVVGVSAGLAARESSRMAARQHEAEPLCRFNDAGGIECTAEGIAALAVAQEHSRRMGRRGTLAILGLVGVFSALHIDEQPTDEATLSWRRKISIGGTIGIAAVGLGIAGAYGLRARAAGPGGSCDDDVPDCVEPPSSAASQAQAAADAEMGKLGLLIAGVAAAGTAASWLTRPSPSGPPPPATGRGIQFQPEIAPGEVRLGIRGTF